MKPAAVRGTLGGQELRLRGPNRHLGRANMATTRREFARSLGAAGIMSFPASSTRDAQGANDRIRAAFIGIGNRGSQLLNAALPNTDIEVVALCDAYRP